MQAGQGLGILDIMPGLADLIPPGALASTSNVTEAILSASSNTSANATANNATCAANDTQCWRMDAEKKLAQDQIRVTQLREQLRQAQEGVLVDRQSVELINAVIANANSSDALKNATVDAKTLAAAAQDAQQAAEDAAKAAKEKQEKAKKALEAFIAQQQTDKDKAEAEKAAKLQREIAEADRAAKESTAKATAGEQASKKLAATAKTSFLQVDSTGRRLVDRKRRNRQH